MRKEVAVFRIPQIFQHLIQVLVFDHQVQNVTSQETADILRRRVSLHG